jgi:hypothetical protein
MAPCLAVASLKSAYFLEEWFTSLEGNEDDQAIKRRYGYWYNSSKGFALSSATHSYSCRGVPVRSPVLEPAHMKLNTYKPIRSKFSSL